ncbi:hypothetical protein GCM10008960_00760 [Deinococcus sedimenti]|uniref:Uncharacterized protein n=1 Tax=Deinococcus sedimenti TaxID=1867090 RepID=A0ABQ2S104_9DEIO|nr:hypothetical protein GCM10008960_00760 [Deinococcus sedimenti]
MVKQGVQRSRLRVRRGQVPGVHKQVVGTGAVHLHGPSGTGLLAEHAQQASPREGLHVPVHHAEVQPCPTRRTRHGLLATQKCAQHPAGPVVRQQGHGSRVGHLARATHSRACHGE